MRKVVCSAMLCVIGLAMSACTPGAPSHMRGQVVTGPDAYPAGSTLVVRLADVTSHPVRLVAEDRQALVPGWEAPGTHPPRAFDIGYHQDATTPGHVYVIWAAVYEGRGLTAASVAQTVTISGGGEDGISLGLVPAATIPSSPPLP
jgi:hypothetical protein